MIDVIKKIKDKGLKKSVRMIAVKLKKTERWDSGQLSGRRQQSLDYILNENYDKIIIFENHFGYHNIMLQRPQHITRNLGDEKTLVLYNSYYDIDYKDSTRISEFGTNCYILDMFYYRKAVLEKVAKKNLKKILMIYSTDTVPVSRIQEYKENGFDIAYEYVDDISPDLISKKKFREVMERHQYLVKDKDTKTIATASKLYEDIMEINPDAKAVLISNGAECDKFSVKMENTDQEYLSWIREDRIKVGYYGAMANWVDYTLLKQIAEDDNLQIILIGVEHDESLKESGLLQYQNVRYFGKKPYDKLAGYAQLFDVCMIPFKINSITMATSPVKLFEYMAMGKPVVTTALPECKKYDMVNIAESIKEFHEMICDAAEQGKESAYIQKLQKCAEENDWKAKADELKAFMLGEKVNER